MAPGSAVKTAVRGCLEGKAVRVGTHAKELAVSVNAGCVQRDSLKECLVRDTASRDMIRWNKICRLRAAAVTCRARREGRWHGVSEQCEQSVTRKDQMRP